MKNSFTIVLVLFLMVNACNNVTNSNTLDSDTFNTISERVEVLKKEITSKSDFSNAEFELFNVNGFSNARTLVPGASSWDYKFALKVKPSDINKWTEGMVRFQPNATEIDWTKAIVKKRKEEWMTKSAPEFYKRENGNVLLVVYRKERIIYKRVKGD